uniref:Uncharacterized protein n=1 Tax=Micrurus lemniscatus lemniscatus TaxID=129467 RepID=A0A2D4HPX9_MICLE
MYGQTIVHNVNMEEATKAKREMDVEPINTERKGIHQMINEGIRTIFKDNTKYHTSLQNLWYTMKAYIKGLTIAYNANRKKDREKEYNTLQEEIKYLGTQLQNKSGNTFLSKRVLAKHKLNLLEQEKNL